MPAKLERDGRVWFRHALTAAQLGSLDEAAQLGQCAGTRLFNEIDLSAVSVLAARLLPGARPVRVVAFNKSEKNNWTLPWHQDRVVALRDHVDVEGFFNWTRKVDTWRAEPPISLLEGMLFARVHLDPATTENGCLKLALGTHALGKVAASDVNTVAERAVNEDCLAERGDVLSAKALILHRSAPSRTSAPRRAIRIDYCNQTLPTPLAWAA